MTAAIPVSLVKRIQFITTGNLQSATSATATITAVDTSKAVIIPLPPEDYNTTYNPQRSSLVPSFDSSTVVRMTRTINDATTVIYGKAIVLEFN